MVHGSLHHQRVGHCLPSHILVRVYTLVCVVAVVLALYNNPKAGRSSQDDEYISQCRSAHDRNLTTHSTGKMSIFHTERLSSAVGMSDMWPHFPSLILGALCHGS